jgi:hypothetical protein
MFRILSATLIASCFLAPIASLANDSEATPRAAIPGYRYGDPTLTKSPITLQELELLKKTVLFTDEDVQYLRMAGEVLVPQTQAILDVWYGFVGENPHLIHYFSNKSDGKPNAEYLSRVRARFGQWIKDTTDAKHDQPWLDYQYEFGLRHTRIGKNKTDKVAAAEHIHFRYLAAFIVPITATIEPFLQKGNRSPDEVKKMHAAWTKSVVLQTILWSYPYVKAGDF